MSFETLPRLVLCDNEADAVFLTEIVSECKGRVVEDFNKSALRTWLGIMLCKHSGISDQLKCQWAQTAFNTTQDIVNKMVELVGCHVVDGVEYFLSDSNVYVTNKIIIHTEDKVRDNAESSDSYWQDVLQRRMPLVDEVTRLGYVARAFFSEDQEYDNVLDFISSAKRPFGNKDVPQSIAYVLGWDYQRKLTSEDIPDCVSAEAMKVYYALCVKLRDQK